MRSLRGALGALLVFGLVGACQSLIGVDELKFDLDSGKASEAGIDAGTDAGLEYAATVLADGPLAYWRFDEPSGTIAHDSTDNQHDGTYSGTSLGVDGAIAGNSAVGFDVSNKSYVNFGDVFDFAGTVPFSLEVWISVSSLVQPEPNYMRALSKETYESGSNDGWVLTAYLTASGTAHTKLERWVSGSVACDAVSDGFQPDQYVHVVAVYSGSSAQIYLNGQSSTPNNCVNNLPLAETTVAFMAGKPAIADSDYFQGSLDEVAIYDKALTQPDVQRHYEKGIIK